MRREVGAVKGGISSRWISPHLRGGRSYGRISACSSRREERPPDLDALVAGGGVAIRSQPLALELGRHPPGTTTTWPGWGTASKAGMASKDGRRGVGRWKRAMGGGIDEFEVIFPTAPS